MSALASLPLVFRLVRRELRGGVRGFGVFLACLALGVAAIGAVQSVSRAVLSGMAADGQAILGGDVAVRQLYRAFTDAELSAFRDTGRVSVGAELRAMARAPGDGSAALVEMKAVDGAYPLFGQIELEDGGALPPAIAKQNGEWGAVVEQGALDRAGIGVGGTLTVGELTYRVRGVLVREPDRAAAGTISFAPRLLVSLDSLEAAGLLKPGALVYWNAKVAFAPGWTPDSWRAAINVRFPGAGWRVYDMTNASPQLAGFIERLALFLTLVGLTSLLVGGVGVGNAVRAHLDRRAGTVATLKCLGASSGLVFAVFLGQILALAVVGIVLGLVVGALVPALFGNAIAGLLPVSVRIGVYPGALAQAAVFGLLTALTFSLWPLGRALGIPGAALFRDTIAPASGWPSRSTIGLTLVSALALAGSAVAFADNPIFALWFVLAAVLTFAVFRGASALVVWVARRVRGLRHPALRLAVANLHRPGNPTGAVVLSLGLGLTVLVAVAEIQGNFSTRVSETLPHDAPSFFFIDIQPDQLEPFRALAGGVAGASDLRSVPSLRGRIATVNGKDAESALINRERAWILDGDRGLTYAAEPPAGGEIVAGRWWAPDYQGPPLLAIDTNVAEAFGIGPGDRIGVNVLGRTVEAEVALVRRLDFSRMTINFTLVFSPGVLEGAPQTHIATVRVPPSGEAGLQRDVLAAFPNVTAVRVKDALDTIASVLERVGEAVRGTALITLFAGTLVLAGAMAADHRRRVYDAVVLKVVGATRADVLRTFLAEYGLLGVVTALVASLIGTLGAWCVVTRVMRWEWVFQPLVPVQTVLLSTAITLVFGFAGTWRALGRSAAPLLRNE